MRRLTLSLLLASISAWLVGVSCQPQAKQPTGTALRPAETKATTAVGAGTAPAATGSPATTEATKPPQAAASSAPAKEADGTVGLSRTAPTAPVAPTASLPQGAAAPSGGEAVGIAPLPAMPQQQLPQPRIPDRERGLALSSVEAGAVPGAPGVAAAAPAAVAPTEDQWFTITGQVIWDGGPIPEKKKLNVDKDQDHCLSKGDLYAETWIINPNNKGVKNCVVFLRPEKGKPFKVHESLKSPPTKQVVLDQPTCYFSPRILVMRADQELLVKNPAPIAHNVVLTSFNNNQNVQMPPNSERVFTVIPENNAINITCGAHPWMKGSLWVFEHPYFALTDEDGRFKIPLAPGGTHNLVIWHEEVGWVLGRNGRDFPIMAKDANGNTDVGVFPIKP